jgi:hypothetical protein
MAAGLGFKTFTTGEVLTAADTNGYLMQGVLVFADSAARSAAVTSPQEGQMSYLKDTNATEYYSGSSWVAVGASGGGMTLLSTTTLSGTTTTISSIDQTYKNLQIIVYGVTLSADGVFSFRPNGSNTITDRAQVFIEGSTPGTTGAVASQITSGLAANNMLSTNANNVWIFTINNYANTTNYKTIEYAGRYLNNGSVACAGNGGGGIITNSAITSVAFNAGGNTLSSGTVLIYGVK